MTFLILSTVFGYFLFLPDRAPKQINLAVVPFEITQNSPEYLEHALPNEFVYLLSLSRDVIVIDYESSVDALNSSTPFRGFIRELGATHFVDGVVEVNDDDDETLTLRLVDVTQPAWRTRREATYLLSQTPPLQLLTNGVQLIRGGIYDTSAETLSPRTELNRSFTRYLEAQHSLRLGDTETAIEYAEDSLARTQNEYAALLLAQLVPERETEYLEIALAANPDYAPALIETARNEYERSRDLAGYIQELESMVLKYPNSDAIYELASMYSLMGQYEHSEELLFRWARMRPRSADAAFALAIARSRLQRDESAAEAYMVASARDTDLLTANRGSKYRRLSRYLDSNITQTSVDSSVQRVVGESNDCDVRFTDAFYSDSWQVAYTRLRCVDALFSIPPIRSAPADTEWMRFTSDERYVTWLSSIGADDSSKNKFQPIPIERLFKQRSE